MDKGINYISPKQRGLAGELVSPSPASEAMPAESSQRVALESNTAQLARYAGADGHAVLLRLMPNRTRRADSSLQASSWSMTVLVRNLTRFTVFRP